MPKEYLPSSDITDLENAARNPRDRLLIHLLFHLGCRVSEALGLAMEDIDFASGRVTIAHLKSRVWLNCQHCGARLGLKHEYCPKCGTKSQLTSSERTERRRQRMLPLDSATLDMVRNHIDQNKLVERNGKRYLFNFNRPRAWQIIRECADRAGLPALVNPETGKIRGVSPHRLRDAFAVHAMKIDDSGEGMRLLQEHLGHASFNTTARYRKVASEEHKAWYDRLWQDEDPKENS